MAYGQLGSQANIPWWDDPRARERMWGAEEAPVVMSGAEATQQMPQRAMQPPPRRPQQAQPESRSPYYQTPQQNNALAFIAPPEGGYQWGEMPEGVRPGYQFEPMNTGQNALAYMVPTEGAYQFNPMPEDRERVVEAYNRYGPIGAAQVLGMSPEAVMSMVG
jgi:hypothetical protein